LAAMIAVLELTYNPNIIFPGMIVIVVANVISQQLFKCEGIFVAQLRAAGTPLRWEPDRQILSRVGVRSVMTTKFNSCQRNITVEAAKQLLTGHPRWIVIDEPESDIHILRAADLAQLFESPPDDFAELLEDDTATLDLLTIPGQRFKTLPLHHRANLFEARQLLQKSDYDALYIERPSSNRRQSVLGIITNQMIENYYST